MATLLTTDDIDAAGLPGWRVVAGMLCTRLRLPGYRAGLALVADIGEAAEAADHHPDLDLRYGHLDVRLLSHDVFGLTRRDVRLARRISELADAHGATHHPLEAQELEVAVDTPRPDVVAPFWAAVLALDTHPHAAPDLVDRAGRLPGVWFQRSDARPGRDRMHLDLHVAPDAARARVDAALAAGGTLVSDEHAPAWWVLADADGNTVCVCTTSRGA